MVACRSSSKNTGKMNFKTGFEQSFTTGSYGVAIGCAWCSQKACETCSSLVQKKKKKIEKKKNY
jgi:two-component SAPR family response regulator